MALSESSQTSNFGREDKEKRILSPKSALPATTPLVQRKTGEDENRFQQILDLQRQEEEVEDEEEPDEVLQRKSDRQRQDAADEAPQEPPQSPLSEAAKEGEQEAKEARLRVLARLTESATPCQPANPGEDRGVAWPGANSPTVLGRLESRINAMRGGGKTLPASTRDFFIAPRTRQFVR